MLNLPPPVWAALVLPATPPLTTRTSQGPLDELPEGLPEALQQGSMKALHR